MKDFWGTASMITGIVMVLIGFPAQILKHYREKRFGFSGAMILIPLILYFCRINYSVLIRAWYVLVPDAFGFLMIIVLMFQFFLYRKPS